jgi:hypothetical protein
MPYKFLQNSGIEKTAEQTGHTSQKLFSSPDSLFTGIGLIVNSVLGLVGIVFFILLIYGGYLWMTARGEEGQVEKAKGIITSSIIGLVITMAAFAISVFIMSTFSDTLSN